MFTHRLKTYLHHGEGVWEHGSLYTGEASVSRQEGGRAKSVFNPDARMDHFCLEVMLCISLSRTVAGHLKHKTTSGNKLNGRGKFRKQKKLKKKKEIFSMSDTKYELLLPMFDACFST